MNPHQPQRAVQPDPRHAAALQQQLAQAKRQYEQLLSEHPDHRLAAEVKVRLSDIVFCP